MKLSYPMLAMCVLSLAACNAASDGEPDAVPELVTPAPTGFTPREVTAADIPQDIHEDSWARLPTLSRESLDADDQRAFDIIVNPDSRYATGLRGPIGMWMYSPRMAEHVFPASTYLRYGVDGERDQRLTELAILTTARELDSPSQPSVCAIGSSTTWKGMKQPNSISAKTSSEPRKRHLVNA